MNKKIKKAMAMHECFHIRSNVAKFCLSMKEGGRGLVGIEDNVKEFKSLLNYLLKYSDERMLQAELSAKLSVTMVKPSRNTL